MSVPAASFPPDSLTVRFAARAARRSRRERGLAAVLRWTSRLLVLLVLALPVFLIANAQVASGWREDLLPLVAGSFKAALYAMLVALPLGLGAAIWCARFATPALRSLLKPLFELLEAVPAVVLGLIAALVLAPWLAQRVLTLVLVIAVLPLLALGAGWLWQSLAPADWQRRLRGRELLLLLPVLGLALPLLLSAAPRLAATALGAALEPASPWNGLVIGLMLGLATMPTVFTLAEDALFAVPADLAAGAQALGATRWQALWRLVLPVAAPGVAAALLLGFSRALGETMIVLMASGNTPLLDASPLTGLRSVAANLAQEAPDALRASAHYGSLLLSALLLFGLCLLLNALAEGVRSRLRRRLAGL